MTTLAPSWTELSATVFLSALFGSFLAAFSYWTLGVAFPVSALCSLAVLWSTMRRVRVVLPSDPRRAFVFAVGASAVALFIAVWIHFSHVRPAWVESTYWPRDHTEPPGWLVVPVIASMFGLPLSIAVTEGLASLWHRPLRHVLRVLLPLLAIAVAALSVVGLVRSASHLAPHSPVDGLPVVATFRAPSAAGVTEQHPLGPLTLTVACIESYGVDCHVLLRGNPVASLPPGWPVDVRGLQYNTRQESSVSPGAALQVLRDQRHDLWIVQTPVLHHHPHPIAAFRGPELARVNLSLRDFPGDFAPPRGWCLAALLGVVIAAWFVRRARFVEPQPPGPLVDATLAADHTLHLADGSTPPALSGAATLIGPVVAAVASHVPAPYRDHAPVPVLRAGTLAQWSDALRDERDVRHALAFSTLILLGAPVMIAAGLRLLW